MHQTIKFFFKLIKVKKHQLTNKAKTKKKGSEGAGGKSLSSWKIKTVRIFLIMPRTILIPHHGGLESPGRIFFFYIISLNIIQD